ncbi:MAG: GNAT family N-acetyltransferase [Verrucomicrobiota bacterium]
MATFSEIAYGSADYATACTLRDDVLRRPLGLELSVVDLEQERQCRHFGFFTDGELVACLLVHPREEVGPGTVQIRQLAVEPALQGRGLGRRLMRETEEALAKDGVRRVYLNAREPVIHFYVRLGYVAVGPPHVEIGLAHQRMEKALA